MAEPVKVPFVERHRNTLITVVVLAGLLSLIALETGREIPKGTPAPTLTLKQLDKADPVSFAALQGKPIVLDFWATWCGPCRESLPKLDQLAKQYEGKALFFAVNADDEEVDLIREFALSNAIGMPVLVDGQAASAAYKVQGLPTTVILGKDGKVFESFIGIHHEGDIAHALDKLL